MPADITDFYAFVSYDHPDRVTFIMNVDPFLEPSNGPNYFPFDPSVLYQIKIDNNQRRACRSDLQYPVPDTDSGSEAVYRLRRCAGKGIDAPKQFACASRPWNTPIVPPAITSSRWCQGAAGFKSASDLHRDHVSWQHREFLLRPR